MRLSEEVRILSMFMQGKGFDEISKELNIDREKVEKTINSILSYRSDSEDSEDFDGYEKELMGLYRIQKKRVMRYINLERNMRIPLPETKDNMIILLKILEVMWKISRGVRVGLQDIKRDLFGVVDVGD